MTNRNQSRRRSLIAAVCLLGVLLAVSLLETYGGRIPVPFLRGIFSNISLLYPVLTKGAIYALVAVSMNLLNGFTGLFSLGQAGFMLLGAYTYAILTVPGAQRDAVYYIYGSVIRGSLPEVFSGLLGSTGVGGAVSLALGVLVALVCAGLVAAGFAYLIGLPVLRLRSDYLAIATLGFAEIIRAVFQWEALGPLTNGANMLKSYPTYASFNLRDAGGAVVFRFAAALPILLAGVCVWMIVLLIHSSYGRAFQAIREDEIAAEAMGIHLARHKRLAFCISSFFAGVGGGMLAMYTNQVQAKAFTAAMTYELLLIVVIGGIGSVTGSCLASFLYVACSEWWLRFLDTEIILASGAKVPLLRNGFRMVVFSVVIMLVVLFFRRGIMGTRELPDLFRRKKRGVAK